MVVKLNIVCVLKTLQSSWTYINDIKTMFFLAKTFTMYTLHALHETVSTLLTCVNSTFYLHALGLKHYIVYLKLYSLKTEKKKKTSLDYLGSIELNVCTVK